MKNQQTAQTSIEKNSEIYQNYLQENKQVFETDKIVNLYNKLQSNSKDNLRECIYLGGIFEGVKARFLSAESKQARKNLGLKVGIKEFIETNYSNAVTPISESYFNRHIKAFNNSKLMFFNECTMLEAYLKEGHIGKAINIDNFNSFCNPKKEKVAEVEAVEVEAVEVEAVEVEAVDFGGVKLSLSKATKDDIEKAIEYLMNKIS